MKRGALLALFLVARTASADGDPHPLEFGGEIDPPVLAFTGFTWIAGALMQSTIIPHPTCDPCNASDVNPIDRSLAGRRNSVADGISWGLVGVLIAAPLALDGFDVVRQGGRPRYFLDDLGVFLEALTVDAAINEVVKLAVQRPRPLTYDPTLPANLRASSENYVSFYSEHSSLAFTAAAAYATIFALHHRHHRGAIAAVAAIALGLASATAALRVVAGKHFYTDVAVGALAGTAIGISIPLLHRRGVELPRVAFAPLDHGVMATATLFR